MRRFHALVILLVCCLAFSAFVGCGAQKEEPAMKTFENKNLSVSYPEGWSVSEEVDEENEFIPASVKIGIDYTQVELTNDAYMLITIDRNNKLQDFPEKPEDIRRNKIIGDIDFETITEIIEKDKSEIKYCFGKKDGNSITITMQYSENNKEMIEKILGTLKFKF